MTWFHLSPDKSLDSIVPSTNAPTPIGAISPRVPESSHGEDPIVRVCVAPTVWQCVLSIPRYGTLYIYSIDTDAVTDPTGTIADNKTTHEKWITDKDVQQSNGKVALTYRGYVNIDRQLMTSLKVHSHKNNLPLAPKDESSVWNIREEQWSLTQKFIT